MDIHIIYKILGINIAYFNIFNGKNGVDNIKIGIKKCI